MAQTVSQRNSDKLDSIALTVNSTAEKVSHMEGSLTEIRTDVKELRKAIYGNGSGEAGIIGRLKTVEDWKDARIWLEKVIITALVGEGIGLVVLVLHTLLSPK